MSESTRFANGHCGSVASGFYLEIHKAAAPHKSRIPLQTAGQRTKEADKKKGIGEVYERKGFGSRYFRDKCI